MTTTLSALQAGNPRVAFVLAIDGYPHLISNVPQALVQAAWSATDWATKTVIGGLTIDLNNHQKLNPWNPFEGGGSLIFRVQPDADDTFGIDMHRTDDGAETLLEETVDRIAPLFVGLVDGFALIGEAHVGTECFSYGFTAGRRFQPTLGEVAGSNRGKYVAFGVDDSTATYGSIRFAEHHRVATQNNGVVFQPVVSEQPRIWKGRRVSLWQHVYESDGSLNTKANALCIFVGEIVEPQDESDTGHTSVLCEHLLNRIPKTTLLRDQWQATVDYGLQLTAGHRFNFEDFDGTIHVANPLVVVDSSATTTSTNEVAAGQYGHEEFANIINNWLAGESAASRISGQYTLVCPEDVAGTARTVMHAFIAGSGGDSGHFKMRWPVAGWAKPLGFSGSQIWIDWFYLGADHQLKSPGAVQPFAFAVADLNNTFQVALEDQTGTYYPQNDTLPAAAKAMFAAENPQRQYGLFLLESETPMLVLGSVQGDFLRGIRPLGSGFGLDLKGWAALLESKIAVGSAAPKLRQVFVHEGPLRSVLRWLFMSTGTQGYNNSTYDVLPPGQGLAIPYDALGEDFELSCDALPGADNIVTITLEKPRKFEDLIGSDLVIRNAHLVFREGQFRFVSWSSPSSATATTVLDETNKAEPINNRISHRSASVLDSSWLANVCKISYNRDIAKAVGGGEDVYLAAPIFLEDATSIDDMGGSPTVKSVDLKNVYNDTDQIGQGVRALVSGFLSWFTWWSRPLWKIRRSIAPTLYEGFGVADVAAVTDPFVRDPTSGQRGIVTRPGLVVGHQYRIQTFGAPEQMKTTGEVDVVFLASDRTYTYAPAAEVDETANDGGFTAGFDGSSTLKFKAHEHSTAFESVDIASFNENDRVLIIEIDPDDPNDPMFWERTIDVPNTGTGTVTMTNTIDTPTFDTGKRYRMVYQPYSAVVNLQVLKSFQAGQNKTIAEASPPDVYGAFKLSIGAGRPTRYDHTTLPEMLATDSYGPNVGAARDCAYDKELSLLIDNQLDHTSRLSAPTYDLETSVSSGVDGWKILKVEIVCIGQSLYTGTTQRFLHLAPNWRNANASTASVPTQLRVWVSGYPPTGPTNANPYFGTQGYTIKAPAAGNTWSAMPPDTLWRQEEPKVYPLVNFNGHQFVYIITEGTTNAQYRGLCECRESERQEFA